jgi:diacylglycerol kinase
MSSNRLTQARIKEREKTNVCITANIAQAVVAPSKFRVAMATMGPVLASAFCVAAIMYPLGLLL